MFMIVMTAYPLSKTTREFRGRQIYMWYFLFAMLFDGGIIPKYVTFNTYGLLNSFWALILPGMVSIWNIILMMNFFRSVPPALVEAARIDGANDFQILWKIYVPLSKAAMATIGLFVTVQHWNSYFDGLMYLNNSKDYPLQTYLQTVIRAADALLNNPNINLEQYEMISRISDKTIKCANVFLVALPILMVYPFLQKYFVKGLVMGGVKE